MNNRSRCACVCVSVSVHSDNKRMPLHTHSRKHARRDKRTRTRTHIHTRERTRRRRIKNYNDVKRKGCVTIDILRVQSHAICLYAALYIELESSGSLFRRVDCVCTVRAHYSLVTRALRVACHLARHSLFHL